MAKPLVHFPHNYNYVSRAVMYSWLNKHLKLGLPEPVVERDFQPLSVEEMTVWDAEHPQPPKGRPYERTLVRWITDDSQKQMTALVPKDADSLAKWREVAGGAIDIMIGRQLPAAGTVKVIERKKEEHPDWVLVKQLIQNSAEHEEVPSLLLRPNAWNERLVVWVTREGKQGLFDAEGQPKPAVAKLLAAGVAVLGIDLFEQGEFTLDGRPIAHARVAGDSSKGWAKSAGFTLGYNYSVFAKRVHDILTVVAAAKEQLKAREVDLVGLDGAGHWVAAARAQAGSAIARAVVDTAGFRFAQVAALSDPDLWPGGAKYLDLPGVLSLSAPGPLWLSDAGAEAAPVLRAAYQSAGSPANLTVYRDPTGQADAAMAWLLH